MNKNILEELGFYEIEENEFAWDDDSKGITLMMDLNFSYIEVFEDGELIEDSNNLKEIFKIIAKYI